MSEIEIREYVRTNDGIFKVTKIDGLYIYLDKEYFDNQYQMMRDVTFKERILKHSFNIIDLIEVGDFVNENEVIDKYLFNGEIPVLETTGDETNAKCMCESDIRTILTHEQYERNCYKIN